MLPHFPSHKETEELTHCAVTNLSVYLTFFFSDGMDEDELDIEDDDFDEEEMVEEMDDGVIGLEITGNGMPPNAIARARRTLERLASGDMGGIHGAFSLAEHGIEHYGPDDAVLMALPSARREYQLLRGGRGASIVNLAFDPDGEGRRNRFLGAEDMIPSPHEIGDIRTLLDPRLQLQSGGMELGSPVYVQRRYGGHGSSYDGPQSSLGQRSSPYAVHPFLSPRYPHDRRPRAIPSRSPRDSHTQPSETSDGQAAESLLSCLRRYTREVNNGRARPASLTGTVSENFANGGGSGQALSSLRRRSEVSGDSVAEMSAVVGPGRGVASRAASLITSVDEELMSHRRHHHRPGLQTSVYSSMPSYTGRASSPTPPLAGQIRTLWSYAPLGNGGDMLPKLFAGGDTSALSESLGALERIGAIAFNDLNEPAKIDYHILTTIRDMVKGITHSEAKIRKEHEKEDLERKKKKEEKRKRREKNRKTTDGKSETEMRAGASTDATAPGIRLGNEDVVDDAMEERRAAQEMAETADEGNREEATIDAISVQRASSSPDPVISLEVDDALPGLAADESDEEVMESEHPAPEGENSSEAEVNVDVAANDMEVQVEGNEQPEASTDEITPATANNQNSENNLPTGEPEVSALIARRCLAAGLGLSHPESEGADAYAAALTSSGIDPSFLIPLPREFRMEVLTQHFEEQETSNPSDTPQNLPETTRFTREFLIVLPPDVRRDVLEGEINFQVERARRARSSAGRENGGVSGGGAGEEMDNASFLASLEPELREEIFLTSDDALLSTLPPTLAAEARLLREREHRRVSPSSSGARILDPYVISRYTGERRGRRGHERSRHVAEWVLKDGEWEYSNTHREKDFPLSLSPDSLSVIINLLRIPQSLGKGLMYRVLAIACKNPEARKHVMNSIFDVVMQPSHPPGQFLKGGKDGTFAPRSIIIRRGLDLLTSLIKNEERVAEDFVAIPRSRQGTLAGSSKDVVDPKDSTAMVTRLAGLLSDPVFGRSDTHIEQLITLLVAACDALPPAVTKVADVDKPKESMADGASSPGEIAGVDANRESATRESAANESGDLAMVVDTEVQESSDPRANNDQLENQSAVAANVDEESRAERVRAPSASATPEDNEQAAKASKSGQKAKEKKKEVRIPVERRVPKFRDDDLIALAGVLGKDGLSEKTYSRVIQVIDALAELPKNRETLIAALSNAVSLSGKNVADRFMAFVNELQGLSPAEEKASISRFSMSSLPDELRLLRVAKTISALSKKVEDPRKKESKAEKDEDADDNTEEIDAQAYNILTRAFGGIYSLWACLDKVLDIIGDNRNENKKAEDHLSSERGRSLRALNSSRRSGRHTVPPALALLCPVVETFFVAHSLPGDSHRKPAPTQGDSTSRPGSPRMGTEKSNTEHPHDNFALILGAFIEKHRGAINTILRGNPSLLDGSFRSALCHASMIDFDNKKAYFRGLVRKRNSDVHASSIRITVPRDSVFASSYNHLRMRSPQEMKGRLHVQFAGEEGIDAGGLTREWYTILIRNVFDPMYALFKRSAGKAATYQPDRRSYVNHDQHLDYFKFVGRIIGKAIYDGQLLDAYFARSFYKHILGIKPSYHDMELEEPEYYKSLCWILENDITDVMDLTMSAEFDFFGTQKIVDLVPNGQNIPVTNENKMQYVQLVTDLRLSKAIEKQIAAFLVGFHELVPAEDIQIFNEVELELLMSGLPDIDVADLKANIEYSGYTASSAHISWFWKSVAKMGSEDLARLIMFVTGTSKVPLEGFSALQGMNGPQKFQIHRVPGDSDRLPTAHTCFNQLDLPEYSSAEKLHNRLLCAIREGSEGFGFG